MKDFVKVSIPKEHIVQDELNGQCGSCRFKASHKKRTMGNIKIV